MRQWFASRWRACRRSSLEGLAVHSGSDGLAVLVRPLIIAPHPDDEVLGCGGLIARCRAGGGRVQVVILTGGERSHEGCCRLDGRAVSQARRRLAVKAGNRLILQQSCFTFLDWGDGRVGLGGPGEFSRRTDELAQVIERIQPEAVFAPHPFEGWSDHEAAERITRAAIARSGVTCRLFHYCVWFWFSMPLRRAFRIDWHKARLLDIADVYEHKQAAIDEYLKPCAPCGNPWSGVLPREFLNAFKWKKELFFEADIAGEQADGDHIGIEEGVPSL
mgnify:CR=1 FL=1